MTGGYLPYGRQEISEADISAVAESLRQPLITDGPGVTAFEDAMARYLGAKHVVAVSSGTAALHAAAFAIGLGPGDDCLVPAMTFAASANCALYVGATPRFVDIDLATWNIDTDATLNRVASSTGAIMAVSFAGLPVDISSLRSAGLPIVEDACHALGARREGRLVGAPGGADITCFSLHPVKAMTTGEGGLAVTEDDDLADRLRAFKTHGIVREGLRPEPWEGSWYYEMRALGFNYRITDIQCALGRSQLTRLDRWVVRRGEIAASYRKLLADEARLQLPPAAAAGELHGYHLFPVRVLTGRDARRQVFDGMRAAGIGVQVHYIPVYRLPYYRDQLRYPQDGCPNTEALYSGSISLPIFPSMTDGDIARVVGELTRLLDEHA
jgi:perosamine synthetase